MPITPCKLEMVFTLSLFDSMEHFPVHLAYEAKVGGPQQYRWMYPFERFLRTLKHKIKNSRYIEGSIAEAYLVEEAAKFTSYYYPPEMMSRWRGVPHNDDAGDTRDKKSIFNFPGRVVGKCWRSTLDRRYKRVAECYFSNWVRSKNPSMAEFEVDQFTNSEFPKWLRFYFVENPSDPNEVAWSLSYGAAISFTRCKKYIINGYQFSTVDTNAGHDHRGCGAVRVMSEKGLSQYLFSAALRENPVKKIAAIVMIWEGEYALVQMDSARDTSSSRRSVEGNLSRVGPEDRLAVAASVGRKEDRQDGWHEGKGSVNASDGLSVNRLLDMPDGLGCGMDCEEVTIPVKEDQETFLRRKRRTRKLRVQYRFYACSGLVEVPIVEVASMTWKEEVFDGEYAFAAERIGGQPQLSPGHYESP
ncbi:hypothetical protein K1719_002406 [Acacia pycnantha]|nr:hypothetical protein K1719_002406 [Acacia pycnantha]